MNDFYAARSRTIPPLPWPSFALPISDILIVTKLGRLGPDAIDVSTIVKTLAEMGVRVYARSRRGITLRSTLAPDFEQTLFRPLTATGGALLPGKIPATHQLIDTTVPCSSAVVLTDQSVCCGSSRSTSPWQVPTSSRETLKEEI